MALQYGIEVAYNTLEKLVIGITHHVRLSNAYSEICVITDEDVTPDHYKRIGEWKEKFKNRHSMFVTESGDLVSTEVSQEMDGLSVELIRIIMDISIRNSVLLFDKPED